MKELIKPSLTEEKAEKDLEQDVAAYCDKICNVFICGANTGDDEPEDILF